MTGQGNWTLQKKTNRCTGARLCNACAADPKVRPHGPYYYLRRRNPYSGHLENVYIGRRKFTDQEMAAINQFYNGEVKPTKKQVLAFVDAQETP